ncbi:hypothetical protein [Streptomyces sp. NPDC002221]|uniref:hypothetical protein n=1 Tax=Streptomyces sp. NPDC002221 TaxID=3364639 RepID=UPI00369BB0DC
MRWLAPVVPVLAATAAYAWARWCFASASPPSQTVAVVGGAVLIVLAAGLYFALAAGSGAFFGALLMALGLFLTMQTAEEATARSRTVTCAVRDVQSRELESSGDGSISKTVYRFTLDCPGGYPSEITEGRQLAKKGAELRISYDPAHRVSPSIEGDSSPWGSAAGAVFLLAVATALAARRGTDDQEAFERRGTRA